MCMCALCMRVCVRMCMCVCVHVCVVCACVSVCEKLEPLSPDLSFLSGLLENQLIGFLVLPPRLLLVLVRVKPWPTAVQQVLPTLVDMREE